jgi:hypothetical protein
VCIHVSNRKIDILKKEKTPTSYSLNPAQTLKRVYSIIEFNKPGSGVEDPCLHENGRNKKLEKTPPSTVSDQHKHSKCAKRRKKKTKSNRGKTYLCLNPKP